MFRGKMGLAQQVVHGVVQLWDGSERRAEGE